MRGGCANRGRVGRKRKVLVDRHRRRAPRIAAELGTSAGNRNALKARRSTGGGRPCRLYHRRVDAPSSNSDERELLTVSGSVDYRSRHISPATNGQRRTAPLRGIGLAALAGSASRISVAQGSPGGLRPHRQQSVAPGLVASSAGARAWRPSCHATQWHRPSSGTPRCEPRPLAGPFSDLAPHWRRRGPPTIPSVGTACLSWVRSMPGRTAA